MHFLPHFGFLIQFNTHTEYAFEHKKKNEKSAYRNLIVFMVTVTAQMLIAHTLWMIGKVNFCFEWLRSSTYTVHTCQCECVKLQNKRNHRKQMYKHKRTLALALEAHNHS